MQRIQRQNDKREKGEELTPADYDSDVGNLKLSYKVNAIGPREKGKSYFRTYVQNGKTYYEKKLLTTRSECKEYFEDVLHGTKLDLDEDAANKEVNILKYI